MNIEAPTFNALNKPQKRALILRDQLRFVDPQHLNEFLEGVSSDEPPTYTKVNGMIRPELALVTLKEEATRFDLGNVIFPEEKNAVHRVYLVVENGQIQMRTEDPLPPDDGVLDSLPIHGFIARGIVPLFRDKFQAIHSRMDKINEARRVAYNMAHKTPTSFHEGETLTRLNPPKTGQACVASPPKNLGKREPNREVRRHVSNKRKRTALDTIPEDIKSKTFDTIPNNIKVDLFNSIVKTAFPNFDNLMTASWNVVSIYSACGSDFPELHRAVVDLKRVLQDFDEAFGRRVDRETPKYRHDFVGPSRSDENGGYEGDCNGDSHGDDSENRSALQDFVNNEKTEGSTYQTNSSIVGNPALQQRKDMRKDGPKQVALKIKPDTRLHLATSQPTQPPEDGDKEEGEIDEDSDEIPHKDPRLYSNNGNRYISTHHSSPSTTSPPNHPHTELQNTASSPLPLSLHLRSTDSRLTHTLSTQKPFPHNLSPSTTSTTTPLHQEPKLRLKMNIAATPADTPSSSETPCHTSSAQDTFLPGNYSGTSLLGARKTASTTGSVAPVVNMLPSGRHREDQGDRAGDRGGR